MRYIRPLAIVAITCSVAAAGRLLYLRSGSHRSRVQPLVAALGQRRFIEARLTGGFPHATLSSASRNAEVAQPPLLLLAAAGEIEKRADAEASAENLHALGVAELLLGRYDAAVAQLEAACAASPVAAERYADLSAAYIARAQAQSRATTLEDLVRAVEAADRALETTPRLDEARFNLALALDSIGLRVDAMAEWSSYLQADVRSGWSSDARAHLEAVSATSRDRSRCLELQSGPPDPLIDATSQCPQEARELGETLLIQWAKAVTRGQSDDAAQSLARAGRLAESIFSRNGDRLLRDSVNAIRSRAGREAYLATGFEALDSARMLYESDQRHLAVDDFTRARRVLQNSGNPYSLVADQSLSRLHTHKRELQDASRILDAVIAQAVARGYRALEARSHWLYGIVKLQMSNPPAALDEYTRAASLYEQLGELGNLSNVSNATADTERILGDFQRGWSSLSLALANMPAVGDPTRRYLALYNGALYAHREQLERASLHFQNETLAIARQHRGPGQVVEASINRAAILGRLERVDDALRALEEAVETIAKLQDPQMRGYMRARVAAARGELLTARNPTESVRQFEAAIEHFTVAEPAEIPRLRLLEGQAFVRGADDARAADAFLAGAKSFEDRLRRLRHDQQRIAYSDEGWEIYQQLVELRVRQGSLFEALAISDMARSRVTDESDERLPSAKLRSLLPASQRVVFYAVLAHETHAWVFGPAGVDHRTIPAGEKQLEQMASQVAKLVGGWNSPATLNALLAHLHAVLVAPLNIPDEASEVIVVPDGPLRLVPFASLRDANGRFLVERKAILVSHSLASLTRALEHESAGGIRIPVKALVVGDPKFDTAQSPRLPDLPFAAREAANIAQMYKDAALLVGARAIRADVLKILPAADVFHFAGHSVANDEFPDLSRLLLTPSGTDSGDLIARDLQSARLKPGSIVVLSACQTARGPERRAAGVQSLARAFLAVGARDVVAASWNLDDRDTSQLMTTFHEHLSRGESPAQSLRSAQLTLIAAGRPVSSWAAFVPFTGGINAR